MHKRKKNVYASINLRSYIDVTFTPIYVFMDDKNNHKDDENERNSGMYIDPLVRPFSATFYSLIVLISLLLKQWYIFATSFQ